MTTINAPLCYDCKRFNVEALTCAAFPNGIPRDILWTEFDHRKPHKGDGGILFDPKPDTNVELLDFIYEEV